MIYVSSKLPYINSNKTNSLPNQSSMQTMSATSLVFHNYNHRKLASVNSSNKTKITIKKINISSKNHKTSYNNMENVRGKKCKISINNTNSVNISAMLNKDSKLKNKILTLEKKYSIDYVKVNEILFPNSSVKTIHKRKTNSNVVKNSFKNIDLFSKYLIKRFLGNKRNIAKNLPCDNDIQRNIFIIKSGSIVINKNKIDGTFITIPTRKYLINLKEQKRNILLMNILTNLKEVLKFKKNSINLFSPNKELITDLLDISIKYKFLYASQTIICKGISIVSTPKLSEIYKYEFPIFLKEIKNKLNQTEKQKTKFFKIKNIRNGINPNLEKLKPHYSFTNGENEIEYINYMNYSYSKERKEETSKKIPGNISKTKNDFFLYMTNLATKRKIQNLKIKLNYPKEIDLYKDYQDFESNLDKLISKYKIELKNKLTTYQQKLLKQFPKYTEIDDVISSYNMQNPNSKELSKLFIKTNSEKTIEKKNYINNQNSTQAYFYYKLKEKVNKYYPPFIFYNIPKLLNEFKNYTRRKIFEIYIQYKDLITLSYALNKNEFILQNGIDFNTFWKCISELSRENKSFTESLFKQINKSKLCVVNLHDFFKGIYFVKNCELSEKMEYFLKVLDVSKKGRINFKETVNICKNSILRKLNEDNLNKENSVLEELSNFFAEFIFKLIGVDKSNELEISELKKYIDNCKKEDYGIEYLEFFSRTK